MDREPLLLSPADVAARLGVGRSAVYRLIADGRLPIVQVGRRARIPLDSLREWIRQEAGLELQSRRRSAS